MTLETRPADVDNLILMLLSYDSCFKQLRMAVPEYWHAYLANLASHSDDNSSRVILHLLEFLNCALGSTVNHLGATKQLQFWFRLVGGW